MVTDSCYYKYSSEQTVVHLYISVYLSLLQSKYLEVEFLSHGLYILNCPPENFSISSSMGEKGSFQPYQVLTKVPFAFESYILWSCCVLLFASKYLRLTFDVPKCLFITVSIERISVVVEMKEFLEKRFFRWKIVIVL